MRRIVKNSKLKTVAAFAEARTDVCTSGCIELAVAQYGGTYDFPCGREDSQYVTLVDPLHQGHMFGMAGLG